MSTNQWITRFFTGLNQKNVQDVAQKILTQTTDDFATQLANIKSKITHSEAFDEREFPDIEWDEKLDSKTERYFLRQIAKELDKIASTPLGQSILGNICKHTRFGTAPMKKTGGYFNRNLPAVLVQSSFEILKKQNLLIKILSHECTHARNREMSEQLNAVLLPPRLLFMHQMMNELSAYLNEQVIVAQLSDKNATHQSTITDEQIVDLLDKLQDNKYVKDFSERLTKWHGKKILEPENKSFSEEQLVPFAYYFKMCPPLKNQYIILKLNQLYNNHVIKPFRSKMMQQKENTPHR